MDAEIQLARQPFGDSDQIERAFQRNYPPDKTELPRRTGFGEGHRQEAIVIDAAGRHNMQALRFQFREIAFDDASGHFFERRQRCGKTGL